MRTLLSEARRNGREFYSAWAEAMDSGIDWPSSRRAAVQWREALEDTVTAWSDAYDGRQGEELGMADLALATGDDYVLITEE